MSLFYTVILTIKTSIQNVLTSSDHWIVYFFKSCVQWHTALRIIIDKISFLEEIGIIISNGKLKSIAF